MSQLLEMWQLRQALDMQASAMWLIFTAQLCRAIAAWLAPQKAFSFIFLSHFSSFCLCLAPQFGLLRYAYGFTALKLLFWKDIIVIIFPIMSIAIKWMI